MPRKTTIADLRQRLTIQTSTSATDAIGGQTPAWKENCEAWGCVEMVSGTERAIVGQLQGTAAYRVTLRHRADISSKDRIIYGARTLEVLSALDPDGRRKFLVCDCAEVTT